MTAADQTSWATLAGAPVAFLELHAPSRGPWWADVDLTGDDAATGAVALVLGPSTLRGTVDDARSGTFGLRRRARVVAGAGSWGAPVPAKGYHNDAGVSARLVAEDAAREVGETLAPDAVFAAQTLGRDYARPAGPASRALEDALGGVPWWVGYDGVTRAAPERSGVAGAYEVLEFDPRTRLATVALPDDDLGALPVGCTLSERLDAPVVVREILLRADAEKARVVAWCPPEEGAGSRIPDALRRIVRKVVGGPLTGLYRFRVGDVTGDRLSLQAVLAAEGLPGMLLVSAFPGLPGVQATPALGTEILVAFEGGAPTRPLVVAWAGHDGPSWQPTTLLLDALTSIKLGAGATSKVALATPTDSNFSALLAAISGAIVVAGDGGANLKATILSALTGASFPTATGAAKVYAE